MPLAITNFLFVGRIAQPNKGKQIVAMEPAIPLTSWTFALFVVEWNSDKYEVSAEKGPVNL